MRNLIYKLQDSPQRVVNWVSVKLPPFWPKKMWNYGFAQVEAQFTIAHVTQENTRFCIRLRCQTSDASVPSVKTLTESSLFHAVLAEFPTLTRPAGTPREVKHNTLHFIKTTPGPPISCRPRLAVLHLIALKSPKAAIICHPESSWLQALPLVLLVYGEPLRLPGSLLASPPGLGRSEDISDLVVRLQRQTSRLQPVSGSAHSKPQTFVFQELSTCTHVFLRDDTVRRALQPPYSGPHKVLSRDDKTMTIQIADRSSKVSIDRVKPAYILPDPSPQPQPRSAHTPVPSIGTPAADPGQRNTRVCYQIWSQWCVYGLIPDFQSP
ncbi:uncharacterized protein LOC124371162 [Homalodisca vitripennis]|uniref:uncharacterized protein LOC124371162 n=1 Tax=Homalodisca vitripennis TaxID=197043 RepID=UPI001EEBE273|nr:uncharacterized protein LOC124371162 [Homalodisca vitripennis]